MSQAPGIHVSDRFPRYRQFDPKVPVWCITPNEGRCIHRFFDTSPVSPSGRYVALFRMPFEDRLNQAGEAGQVVLIDLQAGGERVVAETRGWESQMGCNLNWGADDHTLVFNDVDTSTWSTHLVKLDPLTGESRKLAGSVYHVSPDGRYAASASMAAMRRTQVGYGVVLPDERVPRNIGARSDDGLFITDLQSGQCRLLLPLSEAVKAIPELRDQRLEDWEVYGFHSKWNPQGDRLMFTVRRFRKDLDQRFDVIQRGNLLRYDVLTLRPDGSDLHNAIPAEQWDKGGHHTNWFPDGEHLSANLAIDRQGMCLIRCRYDGSDLRKILQKTPGSGHPTLHPDGRHILTDAYAWERISFGDGTVPLRWIDRQSDTERTLARIGAMTTPAAHVALRIDAHPVWDRSWRWVTFNGVAGDNTRRVFLADLSALVGGEK